MGPTTLEATVASHEKFQQGGGLHRSKWWGIICHHLSNSCEKCGVPGYPSMTPWEQDIDLWSMEIYGVIIVPVFLPLVLKMFQASSKSFVEMPRPRACRPAAASAPSSVEHVPIPPGLRRLSAHPWHRSLVSRCFQPIRPLPNMTQWYAVAVTYVGGLIISILGIGLSFSRAGMIEVEIHHD